MLLNIVLPFVGVAVIASVLFYVKLFAIVAPAFRSARPGRRFGLTAKLWAAMIIGAPFFGVAYIAGIMWLGERRYWMMLIGRVATRMIVNGNFGPAEAGRFASVALHALGAPRRGEADEPITVGAPDSPVKISMMSREVFEQQIRDGATSSLQPIESCGDPNCAIHGDRDGAVPAEEPGDQFRVEDHVPDCGDPGCHIHHADPDEDITADDLAARYDAMQEEVDQVMGFVVEMADLPLDVDDKTLRAAWAKVRAGMNCSFRAQHVLSAHMRAEQRRQAAADVVG